MDQIKKDPVILEACRKELSVFNCRASELLLKHSKLDRLCDSDLAINFQLHRGTHYISGGLEGLKGIHLELVIQGYTADPSFGQQIHENVQHKYFFRK